MLVVVHAVSARSQRGWLRAGSVLIPCALGSGGLKVLKREGDGATPAGRHEALSFAYRADRRLPPRCALPLRPIRPFDGWSDDPARLPYNARVRLPFAGSHEKMMRTDRLYDVVGILDYNIRPAVRGRGSAIFFHLTRNADRPPTAGCIAIDPGSMDRLMRRSGGRLTFLVPPFKQRPRHRRQP